MRSLILWIFAFLLAVPAVGWAAFHERRIRRKGQAPAEKELRDAEAIGVVHPERIRILAVDSIPNPLRGVFACLERWTSLCVLNAQGLTLRYGIYAVPPFDTDREILAHEFAHVRQYEMAGSRFGFLRRYIAQCMECGYENAEFERDARERAEAVVGRGRNRPETS